jgi:hypothetical protein
LTEATSTGLLEAENWELITLLGVARPPQRKQRVYTIEGVTGKFTGFFGAKSG